MRVALGLSENRPLPEQDEYAREAARLGFEAMWTNEGDVRDAFVTCARWVTVAPGLGAGIAVVPVLLRLPMATAMAAATLSELTCGRFALGLGPADVAEYHHLYGTPEHPAVALMRDYVTAVRALLAGERVTYQGKTLSVNGARLELYPTANAVPIYLGVVGPQMLRLSGQIADGVVLNWCTAEQVAVYRDQIAEGAARVNRPASRVTIGEYVRVCVSDDVEAARRALARAALSYVAGSGAYRAHFTRMGFGTVVEQVGGMVDGGAPADDAAAAIPNEVLERVGYYGPASGVGEALRALAAHLDLLIVRVVPVGSNPEDTMRVIRAAAPRTIAG